MHPRYEVEKVYEAEVEGIPDEAVIVHLRAGVALDDGRTAPAGARLLRRDEDRAVLELSLHEGRKHQVKRMCEAVGHPVRRLHRRVYAGLELGDLAPGEWRELRPDEVARLRELTARPGSTATSPRA
jgi:23S rRNA pseudouridine2605 synthase